MAIATAIQRGSRVYVYDERKHELFSKNGELHGYTGSSVSIKDETVFMFMMKKATRQPIYQQNK